MIGNNKFVWVVFGDPPSAKNNLRISRRGQVYHKDNSVITYKQLFAFQTPAKFKKNITMPVYVHTVIYCKNRRKDFHNLTAVVYDALEYAGVIKNDRLIVAWSATTGIDSFKPRVELWVQEIDKTEGARIAFAI